MTHPPFFNSVLSPGGERGSRTYAFRKSFDRQKFITDFYKQYNDTKTFEAAILELVLDKQKEQYTLILNSPRTEIEKNILIYEKHPLFDEMYFGCSFFMLYMLYLLNV